MSGIMRKRVEPRMMPNQPTGDEIDRQRETVHLDKERYDKGGKRAEGSPIPLRFLGLVKLKAKIIKTSEN